MNLDPQPALLPGRRMYEELLVERFGCNQWWISGETRAQPDNDLNCGARRVALREALNEYDDVEVA